MVLVIELEVGTGHRGRDCGKIDGGGNGRSYASLRLMVQG